MNPKALIRLLLETSGHADQNVAKLLARDTDSLMDAMRGGKVNEFLRGSTEGRALLNNAEFMRMTTKVSGNLDYITRAGRDLSAGRSVNATEFLSKMDIPANSNAGTALTRSITDFNAIAARGASTTASNADAIAAARRTRAPRDVSADEVAERLNRARTGATQTAETAAKQADAAAPAAAKASIQAAADAPRLSFFAARRIANGSESLTSKIELLHRGGRDDLVERVIAKARINGEINMDVARTIGRSDTIPAALKERITNIAASRADPGFLGINARLESVRAFADYARHFPLSSTLQVAKDATLGTISAIRKHPFMTAIGLGGAHYATNGESSRVIGDGVNTAGRAVLGTTASAIAAVATPETAQAVISTAEAGAGLAVDAARNSTAALATVAGRSVGMDVDPAKPSDEISTLLGRNPVGRAAIETVNNMGRVQNHGDAPTAVDGTALGNAVAGARERAEGAAGRVAEGVENAADATALANAVRNPAAAWGQLREAAKTNPTIQKIIEVGDQHPFLKWGMIGGFALGALSNGSPIERISHGIRNALLIGAMMDLIGSAFGRPSYIASMFNQMRTGTPAPAPANTPAPAPAATPQVSAAPEAAPQATPAAQPAAQPAALKSNFAAQAAPVAAPSVDPNSTSFAFRNAAVQPDPARQVVVLPPTAPASNDPVYRRDMPVNPLMMSMGG